jgi:uncharacterized protein (DUF488 family)
MKREAKVIYTFGYQGKRAVDLLAKLEQLDAVLCDVRLSPRSRWAPEWNQKQLAALLGERYVHVPELGNVNYKGGPVEIADLSTGLGTILDLAATRAVVLMCVCSKLCGCHRETIAEALHERSVETEELSLSCNLSTPSLFAELPA